MNILYCLISLLSSSSEGAVQVDCGLQQQILVGHHVELGRKQGLPGREHFEIGHLGTPLVKGLRSFYGTLQVIELSLVLPEHRIINLEGVEVVVDLLTGIKQGLLVSQSGYLLLSLGHTQIGCQLPLVEYGLGQLGDGRRVSLG